MQNLLLLLVLCSYFIAIQGFVCRTNMRDMLKSNSRNEMLNINEGGNPVLPYIFTEGTVSESEKKLFKKVVKFYEDQTCIRLPQVSSNFSQYHLKVHSRAGCATGWHNGYTEIGMKGCGLVGVAHEIGHAYGWGHEQNRIDSSDHIYFVKGVHGRKTGGFKDVEGIPYDYFSVMHYPSPYAVYTDAWLPKDRRITFKIGKMYRNQPVQGNNFMTFNDIKRANYQLRCNRTCSNFKTTWCENYGYLAPPKTPGESCECNCPYGTSGKRCEKGKPLFYSNFCGGTFNEDTILKTPGYDQNKKIGDYRCTYIVEGKPGKQIKLTWLDFDVGYFNQWCRSSYVEVRTTSYWFGSFYCNGRPSMTPTHLTSTGMDLAILINPNGNFKGRGFKAKVEYLDSEKPTGCQNTGEIDVFENSAPKLIYFIGESKLTNCTWKFRTQVSANRIQIRFKKLILTKNKDSSNVIDVLVDPKKSSKRFYRSFNDEMRNISSVGPELVLKTSLLKGSFFEAEVVALPTFNSIVPSNVALCNSSVVTIKDKMESFSSPNYYGTLQKSAVTKYPPNVNCEWNFKSGKPNSKYINVNFEQSKSSKKILSLKTFEIDESDELVLKTDEGAIMKVTEKKQYKLLGKKLSIRFKSDGSKQKTGFFGNVWVE